MAAVQAEEIVMHPSGTPKLNRALSQLQGELPRIAKTKKGKVEGENKAGKYFSYEYSYADLGDVVADVGPLLAKHGLAFHCGPTINPADRREMILTWSLLHESGEEKTGEWPLGPVNQKPQSLGSAITYGRRYCFTAATNIVLEDDDDGQRAQSDHGRQSAGDLWEQSTPARPQQQQQDERRGSALVAQLLRQAAALTTDATADAITRKAAGAHVKGLITRDDQDKIQNTVRARLDELRQNARPVNVEDLARTAASNGNGTPGDDRHKQLVGRVQGHFKRLGFGDDDRADRLWAAAKIAAGGGNIESLNDLDHGELSVVADELAKHRTRRQLEEALAKTGDGDA